MVVCFCFIWVEGAHLGEAAFIVAFLEEDFVLVGLVACWFFVVSECFVGGVVGDLRDSDPFF